MGIVLSVGGCQQGLNNMAYLGLVVADDKALSLSTVTNPITGSFMSTRRCYSQVNFPSLALKVP